MKTILSKTSLTKASTILLLNCAAFVNAKSQVTANNLSVEFQQNNSSNMTNLTDFRAQFINGKTYLNWSVTDTCGECIYYVERSEDGITFESIGVKTGFPSPGTMKLGYSFTDNNPKIVYSYYRIKRVDGNGQISTSWIEIIYNDSSLQTIGNDLAQNLLITEK